MIKLSKLSYLAILVALTGCTYSNDAVFPSLFGSDAQEVNINERDASKAGLILGTTDFKPVNVSKVRKTGTFVGQKVMNFRKELSQLQDSIQNNNAQLQKTRRSVVSNALQYHKNVGTVEAKLQIGTTPGNPRMFEMLNSAQSNIQTMSTDLAMLNRLSASISADTANTDYLSEAIRSAFTISGAVDEDHVHLRTLENEANQTSVLMHSLLNEVNGDISRQQQYIDTANNTLASLNDAVKVGNFGNNSNLAWTSTSSAPARFVNRAPIAPAVQSASATSLNRPLFAVNFANRNVQYRDGLKQAVSSAVAKKSGAVFNVVAVNPIKGSNAQDYASQIFQDIIGMGVSADRVNISSRTDATATAPQVMVFVQ